MGIWNCRCASWMSDLYVGMALALEAMDLRSGFGSWDGVVR